uniref:Tsg N-terminal domain-containing protein n=1 Tax=Cyprinus carpio TaxID=7962 RepID=A0A8C2F690_CYPCA
FGMQPSSSSSSVFLLLSSVSLALACYKALCAGDVSKCLIQVRFSLSDGNCSCCKECVMCVCSLWEQCCDCVGKNSRKHTHTHTFKGQIESGIFRKCCMLLVSFPAAEELSYLQNLLSFLKTLEDSHHNISLPGNSIHDSYNTRGEDVMYFCDVQLYFQHHYSSLQCHMIFRNHSNMMICCSRNISDYYQC